MANDLQEYNLDRIYDLLIAGFTGKTLRRFCRRHSLFQPILARFGPDQGLDDMVDEVVEYCVKNAILHELLEAVEEANPRQYARFHRELGKSAPPPLARPFRTSGATAMSRTWPVLVSIGVLLVVVILFFGIVRPLLSPIPTSTPTEASVAVLTDVPPSTSTTPLARPPYTPTPTSTPTPTPTSTPTPTPTPTSTPTPTPTSTPTNTPTPTPTSTSTPTPTVLYQADWSSGLNGWPGIFGWKALNGMLLSDGSKDPGWTWMSNWIAAPYQLEETSDYIVEADIQLVRKPHCGCYGIVVRGAYQIGVHICGTELVSIRSKDNDIIGNYNFSPDNSWHKYRVELEGNTLKAMIDGAVIAEVMDNRYLSGGTVGLWSDETQINVRSFAVIAP